jgi:hypothetical protein
LLKYISLGNGYFTLWNIGFGAVCACRGALRCIAAYDKPILLPRRREQAGSAADQQGPPMALGVPNNGRRRVT